jgi:peroxiredoxin
MTKKNGGLMIFKLQLRNWTLTCLILFLLFYGCDKEVDAWQTAPDFSLKDLSGNEVSLTQYRGHIVLLDFWATWCPPCRLSIPELVDLQKKYGDQGVVILGISMDDPQMFSDKYLLAFKEKFKINYTILRANNKVAMDYFGTGNMAIPTLFVINKEGKIVDKHMGYLPGAVEESLKKLLG